MAVVVLPKTVLARGNNRNATRNRQRNSLSLKSVCSIGKVLVGLNLALVLYLHNLLDVGRITSRKTKSLVAVQLAGVKLDHYGTYLAPSWRRLVRDRSNYGSSSEVVQADLFIACSEDSCDKIDKEYCTPLRITADATNDINSWRHMLLNRENDELLCYYSQVPDKKNERYRFAHSLNFLQMEPFLSLLGLDYYDYILRTDVDALLFPGLLHVAPDGDGLIGHGYYGEEITDHLVRYFSRKLLPELGDPLRSESAMPPMQSTFYIRSGIFEKFVSALLLATQTLHENAFDREKVCPTIQNLDITRHLVGGGGDVCHWPLWHKGIASLYGTRIAVDHVLRDVTVTNALDSLATGLNIDDQPLVETIQAHVIDIKHIVSRHSPTVTISICLDPKKAIQDVWSRYKEVEEDYSTYADILFGSMEHVIDHPLSYPQTIHYQTADIILQHFRELHGCNWPLHDGDNLPNSAGGNHYITAEDYNAAIQEIEWARSKVVSFQEELENKEIEMKDQEDLMHIAKEEHGRLINDPWIIDLLGDWCGNCTWHLKTTCDDRKNYLIKTQTTPAKALLQAKKNPMCRIA